MFGKKFIRVFILLFLLTTQVASGRSQIRKTNIYQQEETLFIDVDAVIKLPKNVKEAILGGLKLTFNYEFKFEHKAWYKPSPAVEIRKSYLVSYHHITGKFVIDNSVTLEHFEFDTLADVQKFMQHLKNFPLVYASQLPDDVEILAIRFHLTNHNLPAYVSVDRIFNDNWDVDSEWSHWKLP